MNDAVPCTTATLRCRARLRSPSGEPADDRILPVAQLARVDLRSAETHAVLRHRLRILDDPRGVQQRLGRDAADIEADAAERREALDQCDAQAKVGGAECGRIASRTGAQHDEVELEAVLAGRLDACEDVARHQAAAATACELQRSAQPPASAASARCRGMAPRRTARARAAPRAAPSGRSSPRSDQQHHDGRARVRPCRPAFTATLSTVPAAVDGTSIVALSLSTVISGVSTSTPARLHQHVDHRDVLESAEIRNRHRQLHGIARSSPCTSASALPRNPVNRAASAPSMTR